MSVIAWTRLLSIYVCIHNTSGFFRFFCYKTVYGKHSAHMTAVLTNIQLVTAVHNVIFSRFWVRLYKWDFKRFQPNSKTCAIASKFSQYMKKVAYDLIVCNPFFLKKYNYSLISISKIKTKDQKLTFLDAYFEYKKWKLVLKIW